MDFAQMRRHLLSVEHEARQLQGTFESRYADAHLKEVVAFMWLAIVQLEYAELAIQEEPDRTEPSWWHDYEAYMFGGSQ